MPAEPVIHADEALVVADKAAGLLAVPGRGEAGLVNLASQLQQRFPDVQIVHRLDMATSGLLLLARGATMQRQLSLAFAERRVHKQYVAIVEGQPAADAGEVDLPLIADWPRRPRQKVDLADGKPSLTRWRVLARLGARARLLLEPVTGRSHQLRVHMAAQGWPIVGDELYGRSGPDTPRLLLHAQSLQLPHPVDGRSLRFEAELPF